MKASRTPYVVMVVLIAAAAAATLYFSASRTVADEANPSLCLTEGGKLIPAGTDGCFTTCGGEIPWPFQVSNQKVELADSEKYVLMGRVDLRFGQPFFAVDFEKHPWLGTSRRKAAGGYRLRGESSAWEKYVGHRIQLRAVARAVVITGIEGRQYPDLELESLAEPAVVADPPVGKGSEGADLPDPGTTNASLKSGY